MRSLLVCRPPLVVYWNFFWHHAICELLFSTYPQLQVFGCALWSPCPTRPATLSFLRGSCYIVKQDVQPLARLLSANPVSQFFSDSRHAFKGAV